MHTHAAMAGTMTAMTDDALWQRLRHGDEEALREAFGRHSDTVYNVAFRNEARNQVRSRTHVLRLIHRAAADVDDRPPDDAAGWVEALGLPVGTVKSRLSRARRTLATTEVAALLREED